jgi:hypothetical protein
MMVTGFTDNKLSQVATFSRSEPYKVGVNGVTNVVLLTGQTFSDLTVYYNINGIDYVTTFTNTDGYKMGKKLAGKSRTTLGGNLGPGNAKLYIDATSAPENADTIFKSYLSGFDFDEYPMIKDEKYLGQVFTPEIKDEIFIERTSTNVFERHSRLEDINNIEQLENYKNGFYNVKKV